jgi:glycosyltransferase involved in cell wall biosynthesis
VSAFVVAYRVSQETGVPYVLDFRDAWTITDNDFENLRPAWAVRRDRRNLYRVLQTAHAIVFRYRREAECYWRAYAGAFDHAKVHIIPNGFDGSIDDAPIRAGDKCTIVYTGTLSSYRYDALLQALQTLKRGDPERAGRLSLIFVGDSAEGFRRDVHARGLYDIVEIRPPVSHSDVSRLYRDAHGLLVFGRPADMGGYELFAGAKLFEYLKAGRPIVGVLPRDETRNILDRVGATTVADVDSPSEITALLSSLIETWKAGRLEDLAPDRRACEAFSAENQTAALVRALNGEAAAEPFVPGTVDVPPSLRRKIEETDWLSARPRTMVQPVLAGH